MKQLSSKEIKKIELKILLNFNEFCRENNLRYYLAGGTLLGAIRHKGFIPWDDDIDVCMPRPDYERFIRSYSQAQSCYELKSNYLKNFSAPFTKVIDIRTKVLSQFNESGVDTNLWIDIFPVDGLPENLTEVQNIYDKCNFYRTVLNLSSAKLGEGKTAFRKYSKYLLKPLAQIYGKKRCIDKIERIASRYPYETSKYVGAITWGLYGVGERMLKSEFEKEVEVEFEGHKFPAFSCWDSYLKGLYGDYMQLPPVEKRKTHDMVAYLLDEDENQLL